LVKIKVLVIVASKIKKLQARETMKKFLFAAVLMVLVASLAVAEDFPKAEVFAGYTFTKVNGGYDGIFYNAWTSAYTNLSKTVGNRPTFLKRGFTGSATYNFNEVLGIEASVQRNSDEIFKAVYTNSTNDKTYKLRATDFSFNIGPRLAYRKHKVLTPFAHVLVGVNYVKVDPQYEVNGVQNNAAYPKNNYDGLLKAGSDTGFGITAGGGLDASLNKHVAVRIVQVDYVAGFHHDFHMNNVVHDLTPGTLNLSFGVVLRFGGK
jgi:opacity protein-like surface antigen